jgi:4-hydroxy-2-oxoheptanedioate aldolase
VIHQEHHMDWIRPRLQAGECLYGSWLALASPLVAEIIGHAGFDWVLIDQEHSNSDYSTLLSQLQALSASTTSPIVRVPANDPAAIKTALDLGAAGVMIPWVNTADEAQSAVQAMRYPPQGTRGFSSSVRAGGFGRDFKNYSAAANDNVTTIVQIETRTGVDHADAIAAIDGVDVLFVGPADLSLSLGIPSQLEHPLFVSACQTILAACRKHNKRAGILLRKSEQIEKALCDGFSFVAVGTDQGFLQQGLSHAESLMTQYRQQSLGR